MWIIRAQVGGLPHAAAAAEKWWLGEFVVMPYQKQRIPIGSRIKPFKNATMSLGKVLKREGSVITIQVFMDEG